jgi:ribosomal protein S6--L-glutamate ligase
MTQKYDILLLTGGPRAYAPLRIAEEAKKLGISYKIMHIRELNFYFNISKLDILFEGDTIPDAKGVFLRGLGEDAVYNPLKIIATRRYLERGAKVINAQTFMQWPTLDKTLQYALLSEANIPIIESYVFGDKDTALQEANKLGFPLIIKENTGSCGVQVYKIENEIELAEKLGEGYGLRTIKSHIFQRYLTGGQDLRVIILDGTVLGAMKRIAKKGSYLTNFSQGGFVESYDISKDKEACDIALKVAELFKLDYCGVDLMKDKDGKWIVLEVNRACQFQGFEKATGINVAGKIIEFLLG